MTAQADTHPQGGDCLQAPFMGSAVGGTPMRHDDQCDWHTDQYPWECNCTPTQTESN